MTRQSPLHLALLVRDHDGAPAVFRDLYGNLWDLVQPAEGHPLAARV